MSEQARLFLLKDKLERVRKSKRNGIVTIWVSVIIVGLLWNVVYELDFWIGLFLVGGVAITLWWLVDGYYSKQERAILWQIENMSRGNG